MKHCPHCQQELPLTAFAKNTAAPDGRLRLCRACDRVRYLAYRQSPAGKAARRMAKLRSKQKKQEMVDRYKAERGCQECGLMNPLALDLHHLNPNEKDGNLGKLVAADYSYARLRAEIERCVVLCKNCHILAHGKQIQTGHPVCTGQATYPN